MVNMSAPEGCTQCSFDGESYDVENGVVSVPHEAVQDLMCHGFVVLLDPPSLNKKAKKNAE